MDQIHVPMIERRSLFVKMPVYVNVCVDISECVSTPDVCGEQGQCIEVPGTFRCNCTEGLQLSPDEKQCIG